MPFNKNDTNPNNQIQVTNNNNFLQITDINVNNEEESNFIPQYYSESPDFSGKNSPGLDAAGQFLYENNLNYDISLKSIFSTKKGYLFGGLFGNINNDQIANGLFGPTFRWADVFIGPTEGRIFGNITYG